MLLVTMWTLLTAHAADGPDVQLAWIEPTCDQAALRTAVASRAQSICGPARPERLTFQHQPSTTPVGCQVWVHAWCPAGKPVTFQPTASVTVPTLYPDTDFKGTALPLDVGAWELVDIPLRDGGDWRLKVGSVRVPAGWTLRLCSDRGGHGRCTDFTADATKLSDSYVRNDAAAYALVARGPLEATLACPRAFENEGFGGKYLDLCDDLPDLTGSPWNNTISSLLVPAGWTVEVCGNPRTAAPCAPLTSDLRTLSSCAVGNDNVTSVVIRARPR